MKVPKKINLFRRAIMQSLTKNIGKTQFKLANKSEIKTILISRPNNRLGNLLLLTPLVQEVANTFPGCKIDLLVRGNAAPIIFQNYEDVNRIIRLPKKPFSNLYNYFKTWNSIRSQKYDLVINSMQNSSSGKLSTIFANAKYKFFGEYNEDCKLKYPDYQHAAKSSIYNFRNHLAHLGLIESKAEIPLLNLKLSTEEIKNGEKVLHQIVNNNSKTIILFTNATGEKIYSEDWWINFYESIKIAFPNYNIIEMLPIENISKLGFKIPTFYSADIREMGSLLANTALFIGADSGVMHLAGAVGTTTIGLFKVTDENTFKPYGNGSISINTNNIDTNEMLDLIKLALKNPQTENITNNN